MIIYTIGKADVYWNNIRQTAPDPVYKLEGGSVWRTKEEAQACADHNDGFAVFGVFADWKKDTYLDRPNDSFHTLNRNAEIVESRLSPKCHIAPVQPFPMTREASAEYMDRVDANGAFYVVRFDHPHTSTVWRYTPIRPNVEADRAAIVAVMTPSKSRKLEEHWKDVTNERLRRLGWLGLLEEIETDDGYQFVPTALGYALADCAGLMREYEQWSDDMTSFRGNR